MYLTWKKYIVMSVHNIYLAWCPILTWILFTLIYICKERVIIHQINTSLIISAFKLTKRLNFPTIFRHYKGWKHHTSPRKQPIFHDATSNFPTKWFLRNERRNSVLIRSGYCFWLDEANFQPIRSTSQIWVVTHHQYGIPSLVSLRPHVTGKPVFASRNIGCFPSLLNEVVLTQGFTCLTIDPFKSSSTVTGVKCPKVFTRSIVLTGSRVTKVDI